MDTETTAPPLLYQDEIIDGHCHIASTRFIPTDFFDGLSRNVAVKLQAAGVKRTLTQLLDMYLGQCQDHDGDQLVKEMDSAGIHKSVLLLPDFSFVMRSDYSISEMFAAHHAILQRHPGRFAVLAGTDPRWGAEGVDLFEKGITDFGFSGLKLYPPCGYSPSDERLYPYYEICRQHQLPVLLHIGPTSPALEFSWSRPHLVDKAAADFADVNFILAHGAVHHIQECVGMCAYRPNIYLDTGAFLGIAHPGGWQKSLAELFSLGINHKIIFGTDWPVFRFSGGHRKVMDSFLDSSGPLAQVSAIQRSWLMTKNIKRLVKSL